jgi:carbonic anhydrase
MPKTVDPRQALELLREGNRRFVSNQRAEGPASAQRRAEIATSQNPFAIILGCSDSRVPAEIVFDQGLGDLFVIRVAGNIVAPSQLGSIEFAADRFGTSLVVVLGHSRCGAVAATLDTIRQEEEGDPEARVSRCIASIVDRIRPAVEPLVSALPNAEQDELVAACVRANVLASVNQVRHGTALLEELVMKGKLKVVGAEYDLESGEVKFY